MIAFSLAGVAKLLLAILAIAALGYMLGGISIKGVSLGTAGVFIVALLFGVLFPNFLSEALTLKADEWSLSYASNALKIVENVGLVLFVTAVGFIAGPKFFSNFKKNFKSYIVLGLIIILAGGFAAVGCILLGRAVGAGDSNFDPKELTAMIVGLLSGSLTSTPAFSAAKETVEPAYENVVSVGHGIAYLFGVVGVVLFVQLIPKFERADMAAERKKITHEEETVEKSDKKLIEVDPLGVMPFCLAALLGVLVGGVKIARFFSLGTTGGTLLVSLLFGHCGRIGRIRLLPHTSMLKVMRELGLMFFLIGAGIAGGISFAKYFQAVYFVYGIVMTLIPLVIGFFFAKYVLRLPLLNNLGSITGGMTSTPALGTLIHVAGTEDVAAAYASTYPIALIAVVLVSELLIILF